MGAGDQGPSDTERLALDDLVRHLKDADFRGHHQRELGLRETSNHVNPLMLVSAASDSEYVQAWRNHAQRCPACRGLFEYFELLD